MLLHTYIGDDTIITRALIRECFPYGSDKLDVPAAYHKLVALVAHAHEHPELEDLAYLRQFEVVRAEDGWRALRYADFQELLSHEATRNRLTTYGDIIDCGPWSRSRGMNSLRRLKRELRLTREHLERNKR